MSLRHTASREGSAATSSGPQVTVVLVALLVVALVVLPSGLLQSVTPSNDTLDPPPQTTAPREDAGTPGRRELLTSQATGARQNPPRVSADAVRTPRRG